MLQLTIAQLKEAKDMVLPDGEWFLIEQDRISGFAEATEDRQWIHVDPERAAASPFGGTIAHGYLLLSLLPKLLFDVVEFCDSGMIINYGVDRLRFVQPVPSGARVRLRSRVISGQERGGGLMLRMRAELQLEESGKRAMVADLLYLLRAQEEEATKAS